MATTQVTLFDSSVAVPAHIAARMNDKANALNDVVATSVFTPINRISLKAARFRFIMADKTEHVWDELNLDVTVVGAHSGLAKNFYAEAYTGEDVAAPDCWSFDGVRPHHSVAEPRCASCANCPMNKFGSKITPQGKETKACTDTKRLAVVLSDNMQAGTFLLSVSPTALKSMNQYVAELRKRGIPIECVRTRLSFDPSVSYPRLVFKFGGFLDEEQQHTVDSFINSDDVKRIIGIEDAGEAPAVVDVEAKAISFAKAEPAPAPVAEPKKPVIKKPAKKEAAISGTPEPVKAADEPVVVAEGDTAAALAAKLDALFS